MQILHREKQLTFFLPETDVVIVNRPRRDLVAAAAGLDQGRRPRRRGGAVPVAEPVADWRKLTVGGAMIGCK